MVEENYRLYITSVLTHILHTMPSLSHCYIFNKICVIKCIKVHAKNKSCEMIEACL